MSNLEQLSAKLRSTLVGAFILIAYGILMSTLTESQTVIMIADVVSGFAVFGIAILMFPLFRGSDPVMPPAYLVLKGVEGGLMVAAGILYLNPSTRDFRETIYNGIHLYVFIISGALFYILLSRRKLVPDFINIWGLAGICSLALSTIFTLAGKTLAFLDYFLVLIITNEVFLAIWLFVRGLRTQEA